jgi:hypothetical protein
MPRRSATPGRSRRLRADDRRQAVVVELMYVAWRIFDETYGSGREVTEVIAARLEMTLEGGAASLFVRDGEPLLRELLPGVMLQEIEHCLAQRLREVYGGPGRERHEREAARAGIPLEQHLSLDLTLNLLAAFGAFGPAMSELRSPGRTGGSRRSR